MTEEIKAWVTLQLTHKGPHAIEHKVALCIQEMDSQQALRIEKLVRENARMRKALDDIYNHNEASRKAVLQHYGTVHPPSSERALMDVKKYLTEKIEENHGRVALDYSCMLEEIEELERSMATIKRCLDDTKHNWWRLGALGAADLELAQTIATAAIQEGK